MKKQLEILVKKNVNLELFYSVRIYKRCIELQGQFTEQTLQYCKSLGAEMEYNSECNWYFGNTETFNITLTIE